ncbi:MAG: NAD+ synthase [Pseudomonadota bacterium]|nr:NAD+ synthase [Pseudomonadota bacterium]
MSNCLRISLAQLNLMVGDVPANTAKIISTIERARLDHHSDLVVFQELSLCGYPPEDLLFHSGMSNRVADAINKIKQASSGIAIVIGYPEYSEDKIYNSAMWIEDGEIKGNYRKRCLPNYGVFDERRYFSIGNEALVLTAKGVPLGITICEDIWESIDAAQDAVRNGAKLILSINGSPFQLNKQKEREELLASRSLDLGVPILYQNMVGGQDELIFDGGSCVVNQSGEILLRAPAFDESIIFADFNIIKDSSIQALPGEITPLLNASQNIYKAIVSAVRDYVTKNGFEGVVLGLSGGIDSALVLTIAVDALGADAVKAIMMPYLYTSENSIQDAQMQANLLNVEFSLLPIDEMVKASNQILNDVFDGLPLDKTEENIQARCRGILLMAISNKTGRMLLTTGNKSEMAVGYATLYGDMAGGFAPIKDCSKTLVYELARYRNSISEAIPQRVIDREPSAELRPNQKDSDSLPPYEVLDPILDALMIEDLSVDEIASRGFDHNVVGAILDMVRRNEYKRRQSTPGVRISDRAFGRDWRYPITSGYGRSK